LTNPSIRRALKHVEVLALLLIPQTMELFSRRSTTCPRSLD